MTLNQELFKFLKEHKVSDIDQALCYLLSIYHELIVTFPEQTIREVNALGIVERNYKDNSVEWHIALYDGQNTDSVWDWVNDYRKLFASKNKEREGHKKTCVQRMKKFFTEFPHVRKDDVLEATKMYLRTVEPKFVKTSERFIYDGQGAFRQSNLSVWVEKYLELNKKNKADPNIKMMK